jgi:hypothetical protein
MACAKALLQRTKYALREHAQVGNRLPKTRASANDVKVEAAQATTETSFQRAHAILPWEGSAWSDDEDAFPENPGATLTTATNVVFGAGFTNAFRRKPS